MLMCGQKCLVRFLDRFFLLFAEIIFFLSFEKRPMLYNGIFGCHANICYVILINAFFSRYIV